MLPLYTFLVHDSCAPRSPVIVRLSGRWERSVGRVDERTGRGRLNMGCCCSNQEDERSSAKRRAARNQRQHSSSEADKLNAYDQANPTGKHRQKEDKKKKIEYTALWDYSKSSQAELSFSKGDTFVEVGGECDAGPEWLFVTRSNSKSAEPPATKGGSNDGQTASKRSMGGTTGYIPRKYVAAVGSAEAETFWFGDLIRNDVMVLLKGQPEGTFVVRGREDEFKPQMVLSVSFEGKARHYRIKSRSYEEGSAIGGRRLKYFIGNTTFDSLGDMIAHFRNSTDGGLCCVLTNTPPKLPPPKCVISAEVEKHWKEIPRDQIQLEKEVGKGFYGVVYRGIWEPQPRVKLQVAVKELKRGLTDDPKDFLNEAVAMKNLRHEHLVRLLGIVSDGEPYFIITEFIKDGSLRYFLKKRAKELRFVPEEQLVEICRQIADGMHFLERKKVVHRDLAARNVLIQEVDQKLSKQTTGKVSPFDVKIADFGLAQMLQGRTHHEEQSISLPTKWTAPEALLSATFSTASDVWSFGIVLFETFTHAKEPYENMTTQQTRQYVLEEKRQLERPPEMPEKMYTLMATCCDHSPSGRPTFEAILVFLTMYYEKDGAYDSYVPREWRKKTRR